MPDTYEVKIEMKKVSSVLAFVTATLIIAQACAYASGGTVQFGVGSPNLDNKGGPAPAGPTIDPWPMNRYNVTHSGASVTGAPSSSDILWSNATSGNTWGSPLITDGRVYIGGGNAMYAFDHDTGVRLWRTPTDSPPSGGYGVTSSPAYANGMLFYGGDRIYGVNAVTGVVQWRVPTGNLNYGDGSPTVSGSRVYIGGSDRKLYAIEQATGTVVWTFQTGSGGPNNYGLFASPAIWGGYVYLAACDGYVYQINETQPGPTATYFHRFATGNAMYGSPVIYGGNVIVGNGYYTGTLASNKLYALRASDLTQSWRFPTTNTPVSFFSSAAVANDTVFIGSIEGNLYALNPATGVERWRWNIGQTWSGPGIASGKLFIGNKAGNVYSYDASQVRPTNYNWMYATGSDVSSSPAISDGRMCVGTNAGGGQVICFGQSSGPIDNPPVVTAWQPGGTIGQTYNVGDFIPIRWSATDDNPMPANNVNISYGSGLSWTDVVRNTANDGLHSWDTTGVTPGTYWINVSAYDSMGQATWDQGNYSFQMIIAPDNPPIVIAWEPGGSPGQTHIVGQAVQVRWLATDDFPMPANNINISYGNGASWTYIVRNTANDGVQLWDTTIVPLGTYFINVSAYDSKGQSTYDLGNFTFDMVAANQPPTVTIIQPVGGESWTGGSVHIISWSASDAEDPLSSLMLWVNYSITGGAPFNSQVAGLQRVPADSGPFGWTVPLENSATVVLNATIADTAGGRGYDIGGQFEIDSTVPTVSSTNPAPGGMGVPMNANVLTTWSELMNISSAELAFSLQDTATWTSVPGTFSWAGPTMTFNPTALLGPSTQYSANITTAAHDDSDPGNHLASDHVWTFTTAATADATPPTIVSATAVPIPQEVHLPVNVSALIQDDVAVGEAWLNVTDPIGGTSNLTMSFDSSSGRYYLTNGYGLLGVFSFTIWAADTSGNWNSATGQFTVRDTTPPSITDLRVVPNPAEVLNPVNISAIITDNYQVSGAWLNITMPNSTSINMTMTPGARYYWVGTPDQIGLHDLKVWATDSTGHWATTAIQREVRDTVPPVISGVAATPDPVEVASSTNITATVTDNFQLSTVYVNITAPDATWSNHSMLGGSPFYFDASTAQIGTHTFVISAVDSSGNWARVADSLLAVDTTPPTITHTPVASWLTGSDLNLSAMITDNIAVNTVTLNYTDVEGVTRNMTATSGGPNEFHYIIPGQLHSGTITYFFWADDSSGNPARTQTYTTSITGSRPSPPTGLTVTPQGFGTLVLKWNAPTTNEDGSSLTDLAGYAVYRMLVSGGSRVRVNANLVQGTQLTDSGLRDATTYYYVVRAANSSAVYSADSNEASGTTPTPSQPADNTVLILALVLIIVVVLVTFLILIRKKKRRVEEAEMKGKTEEPEALDDKRQGGESGGKSG